MTDRNRPFDGPTTPGECSIDPISESACIDVPSESARVDATSESAGWYLLGVYRLTRESDRAATGALADRLDVEPASVTGMVATLDDDGLCEHRPYEGVALTDRGEAVAAALARRQCAVASYFDRVLSVTLEEETAYRIGRALSQPALDRLARAVDGPVSSACRSIGGCATDCPLESA